MKNYTTAFYNFRYTRNINRNLLIADYKNTPLKATEGIIKAIGEDDVVCRCLCESLIAEKVIVILKS